MADLSRAILTKMNANCKLIGVFMGFFNAGAEYSNNAVGQFVCYGFVATNHNIVYDFATATSCSINLQRILLFSEYKSDLPFSITILDSVPFVPDIQSITNIKGKVLHRLGCVILNVKMKSDIGFL